MYEKWYSTCYIFGMSVEEFWKSNPRIISIWEQMYKEKIKEQNRFVHLWVGTYGLNALRTALSDIVVPAITGKSGKVKYDTEPIELFEPTEEEKEERQKKSTDAFIAWGNSMINLYGKEE